MSKNCYDCKNCAYKPWEYGVVGHCDLNHLDVPLEPLNARYAEWEEPAGSFAGWAKNCPDYEEGERQKLCKEIAQKRREIAGLMEEVDQLIEWSMDFDFHNQDYFSDTAWEIFSAMNTPVPEVQPTENPNRVWKAMKDVGFETRRGTY